MLLFNSPSKKNHSWCGAVYDERRNNLVFMCLSLLYKFTTCAIIS